MKILLTLAAALLYLSGASQNKVSGTLTDENKTPLEFVNVVLFSHPDSIFLKATASASDGHFEFEGISAGDYFVKAAYTGFQEYVSPLFSLGEKPLAPLQITMLAAKNELNEVEVVFKKPIVEVRADKTIFNVENTMNSSGLNALELLRKAPGVLVDNNNNITVKGKSGIVVYIDGKLSPLSGNDLTAFLKSLQSSNIESIEIITNPSAKYDAAGSAGIINIKLKKNKNVGTNGNIQLGYGIMWYSKYNTSFNINHRTEHWNLFASYGNNWGKNYGWMDLNRKQNGDQYDQKTYNVTDEFYQNFKTGADYFINSKNTIGVTVRGNVGSDTWYNTSNTDIYLGGSNSIGKQLSANNTVDNNNNNFNGTFNYHYADTSGTDFNFDIDHGQYTIRNSSFQPNTYSFPGTDISPIQINYRNTTPVDIQISSVKADYERNLGKGKLGAGFKSSYVTTANTYSFYKIENTVDVLDSVRSNQFDYTENINAAYVNFNGMKGKFTYQGGIRVEQTSSHGKLTSFTTLTDEGTRDVRRNYTNLFPSGGITYNVNDTNQFALTYSRRIFRPSYQDLNPFEFKLDELSYNRGNPFLQPQYTNSYDLSYTYMNASTVSFNYSHTQDFFTEVTDTVDGSASFIIKRNLGWQDWFGLNVSTPIPVNKWWNVYVNLNTGVLHNKGTFTDGRIIDLKVWNYSTYIMNTFNPTKTFSIEFGGWFSGPSIWGGTFATKPMGSLDLGCKKELWDGKASLRIAIGDILWTSRWRSDSNFGGVVMTGSGGWESRMFRASFSYNFGNSQVKQKQDKSGAEDLNNRVK
jgi:hypothetical protein